MKRVYIKDERGKDKYFPSTNHLQFNYIPFGTKYKQGMDKQSGYNRALSEMGYVDENGQPSFLAYRNAEREIMRLIGEHKGLDVVYEKNHGKQYKVIDEFQNQQDFEAMTEYYEAELEHKDKRIAAKDEKIKEWSDNCTALRTKNNELLKENEKLKQNNLIIPAEDKEAVKNLVVHRQKKRDEKAGVERRTKEAAKHEAEVKRREADRIANMSEEERLQESFNKLTVKLENDDYYGSDEIKAGLREIDTAKLNDVTAQLNKIRNPNPQPTPATAEDTPAEITTEDDDVDYDLQGNPIPRLQPAPSADYEHIKNLQTPSNESTEAQKDEGFDFD